MHKLADRLINDDPVIYYNSKFRQVVEDALPFIVKNGLYEVITIDDNKSFKYENDLYGLLMDHGVSPHLHWIIMRLNGMTHPGEYQRNQILIKVPEMETIRAMVRLFRIYKK